MRAHRESDERMKASKESAHSFGQLKQLNAPMNTTLSNSLLRLHLWRLRPLRPMLVWLPFFSLTALGAQEGDFLFEPDGAGVVLTGYAGAGGAVVIPERLGGKPVTTIGRIGFVAFSSRSDLTSVTIPNSVTDIGWGAFSSCTGLTSFT